MLPLSRAPSTAGRPPFQRLALLACISSTNQNKFWGVTYPGRKASATLNVCFSLLALRFFGRQASLKNDSAVVAVHKYVVSQTPTPADHPRTERSEGSRQEYGAGHACFSIFVFDISLPFLYSTPYLTPPLYSIPLPWRLSSANSPRYISPFAVVYLPQP